MANDVLQLPSLPMSNGSPALPPPVQPAGFDRDSRDATPQVEDNQSGDGTPVATLERLDSVSNPVQEHRESTPLLPTQNAVQDKSLDGLQSGQTNEAEPLPGPRLDQAAVALDAIPASVPASLVGSSRVATPTETSPRNSEKDASAEAPSRTPGSAQITGSDTHRVQAQNEDHVEKESGQVLAAGAQQQLSNGSPQGSDAPLPSAGRDQSAGSTRLTTNSQSEQSEQPGTPPPVPTAEKTSPSSRRVMPIAPAVVGLKSSTTHPLGDNGSHLISSTSLNVLSGPMSESPDQSSRPVFDHQECANCKTTKTPLWRRGPNGQNLCNACGLYVKARNINRPVTLKRSPVTRMVPLQSMMGSCPGDGRCNGTGGSESCPQCPSFNNNRLLRSQENKDEAAVNMVSCQNCGTVTTPLWRRDSQGHIICNACGLYNRIHKDSRPSDLRTSVIKRRRRNTQASDSPADDLPRGAKKPLAPGAHTVNKLSQPPSPSNGEQHSHANSPRGNEEPCCEHLSPAIQQQQQQQQQPQQPQQPQQQQQQQQQYPYPIFGAQVQPPGQGVQGPVGPYQPPGPPQSQSQPQKAGSVPYGYYPMGQGGPMGLSVMLPPPGAGYVGQPWPLQPAPLGSQYAFPTSMPVPHQGPPPMNLQPHQEPQHVASHQGTPVPVPAYQAPTPDNSVRASVSPQVAPQTVHEVPQPFQSPRPALASATQQGYAPNQQPHPQPHPQQHPQQPHQHPHPQQPHPQQPHHQPPHPQQPPPQQPHEQQQSSQLPGPALSPSHKVSPPPHHAGVSQHTEQAFGAQAAANTAERKSTHKQDLVSILSEKRAGVAGGPDSGDSPLAVLHYLKGASQDTISEYLLAAQRQLHDKVFQLRGSLSRAEFQLKECEDALKEINKNGPS